MDVALECLTTLHGDWQHMYKLKVPTALSKAAARYSSPVKLVFKTLLPSHDIHICLFAI